eukprot:scaffold6934_cov121-Isochrysis_galbana.AAC.7
MVRVTVTPLLARGLGPRGNTLATGARLPTGDSDSRAPRAVRIGIEKPVMRDAAAHLSIAHRSSLACWRLPIFILSHQSGRLQPPSSGAHTAPSPSDVLNALTSQASEKVISISGAIESSL